VLDIATGTGLAAEAAAAAVGPSGHVTAADVSPAMLDRARERLGTLPNVALSVEDGQDLDLRDGRFDAVVCNAACSGPARAGRCPCSPGPTARSWGPRHDRAAHPAKAAEAERFFSPGDERRLRARFEAAGEVEITTETLRFALRPSTLTSAASSGARAT
jgi:hypothetical protein